MSNWNYVLGSVLAVYYSSWGVGQNLTVFFRFFFIGGGGVKNYKSYDKLLEPFWNVQCVVSQ